MHRSCHILEPGPRRTLIVHLLQFLFLFGLYLLLAQSLDWPELLMGAGAAAVAVIGWGALSRHNDVHFRFEPRWFGALLSLPGEIARDSVLVLGSVFPMLARSRTSFGFFQRWRPRDCVPRDKAAAWRAFKTTDISFAPNTYVVDFEKNPNGRILIHRLLDHHTKDARLP